MRHPPLQPGWIDRPHRRLDLGDWVLESGEVLRDAHLCYVVHGPEDAAGDETVLATTAIGSTHHRLDFLIGPGRGLDTTTLRVIVVDALGNGLSSSPSNSARQPGRSFPRFSIRDMVATQQRLLDALGVRRLRAVVGASLGGMQALQWAVSDPQRMRKIVALTPMAKTSRWSQLVNELARRALFADARFAVPRPPDDAWRLWGPLTQAVMPRTPSSIGRFDSRESLVAWIDETSGRLAAHGPDPFDWLYQSFAYDDHDVGGTAGFEGDTTAALASIRAEVLVMAPPLDLYNPSSEARETASAIAGARLVEIPSEWGHQAAAGVDPADAAFIDRHVAEFLQLPARHPG